MNINVLAGVALPHDVSNQALFKKEAGGVNRLLDVAPGTVAQIKDDLVSALRFEFLDLGRNLSRHSLVKSRDAHVTGSVFHHLGDYGRVIQNAARDAHALGLNLRVPTRVSFTVESGWPAIARSS